MANQEQMDFQPSEHIKAVLEQIVQLCAPHKIYLYNQRVGSSGHTTGFKLCVITPCSDCQAVEHDIYVQVDSEIPFDVVLYTPDEWKELSAQSDTFAAKIARTGMLLYG